MRQELKFKLEEESTKSKELEETRAKIKDAASVLGNTRQCTVVNVQYVLNSSIDFLSFIQIVKT